MIPLRRVDRLDYATPVAVTRVPSGEVVIARRTAPLRTRTEGEVAFVLLDESRFVLALSPAALAWPDPMDPDTVHRVMFYTASPDRLAIAEIRRILDPRRRDALYKADLRAPRAS